MKPDLNWTFEYISAGEENFELCLLFHSLKIKLERASLNRVFSHTACEPDLCFKKDLVSGEPM